MNICVFIRELNIGGAEKQSLFLAKALQKKYITYLVVLNNNIIEKKYIEFINNANIEVIFLKGNLLNKLISFINFLKGKNINIIFSFLFSNNILGLIAGKIAGTPFIIGGIRNCTIVKSKFLIAKIMHNKFLNYSVYNNFSGKLYLSSKGFSEQKSIVIPNCFELFLPRKERKSSNRINILTVARFKPQKDYYTSIKAFNYLVCELQNKNNIDFHYFIIGYGPLKEELYNYVNSLKIKDKITMVHKPDNLDQYFDKADIYLSTSLYEGLSNSIMEAMHHSLPIIATNVGDNHKLVKEGFNGYLVEVGDFKGIANLIMNLSCDADTINKFGKTSYNRLKEKYSFEIFRKQYFELIENLKNDK